MTPTFEDILRAAARIAPYAHKTPVLTSQTLDASLGAKIFFKCENFQKVGACKFRGACNAVFSLSEAQAHRGVAAHSSGNHGQALALAARLRAIPAYVVMPDNCPDVKRAAVEAYGGRVVLCEPTQQAREAMAARVVAETGADFVHPSNDARVIAGQGTAALELLQEVRELDIVMAPVGGGGLLAGTALAAAGVLGRVAVIGVEPQVANDAQQSLHSGKIVPALASQTVADGLRTSLGELTFSILRENVREIVTVSEPGIVEAMRWFWERMKIVVEPSSAVPLAALFERKLEVAGKRVGIVISGGNVDFHAAFARNGRSG